METWIFAYTCESGCSEVDYLGIIVFVEDCGADFVEEED